ASHQEVGGCFADRSRWLRGFFKVNGGHWADVNGVVMTVFTRKREEKNEEEGEIQSFSVGVGVDRGDGDHEVVAAEIKVKMEGEGDRAG
ncbi:hypothetical protein HAX54_007099, partial [Datura stramonium]|nr:hypothetical protein [Datura stramonium]